jgi:hypothetical protein
VEEDNEEEKVAPQKEEARPVFSIFNRKKVSVYFRVNSVGS